VAVIAHPENEVRDRELDSDDTNLSGGYHLAGPVIQAGSRSASCWAPEPRCRWAGGEAEVPNAALHLLAGFGFQNRKRRQVLSLRLW